MGIVDELKALTAPPKQKEPEQQGYQPLFMKYVRLRGHFLISETSLKDEKDACITVTKKSFDYWLMSNGLQIKELDKSDHFKICKK